MSGINMSWVNYDLAILGIFLTVGVVGALITWLVAIFSR